MNSLTLILALMSWQCVYCFAVEYDDVFYSSGPLTGTVRVDWAEMSIEQKTYYLEKEYQELEYCLMHLWQPTKTLDKKIGGNEIGGVKTVTYGLIALKYALYGDKVKAAEYQYKDWLNFQKKTNWEPLDDDAIVYKVIAAYKEAGLHSKALRFYRIAYDDMIWRFKNSTDMGLLKTNIKEYKRRWPEEARAYLALTESWEKSKKLAKKEKAKALEPTIQQHEWFYSGKRFEVLKSLDYYHQHNVTFMLEKATEHKDPVVAAKAKEYLQKP